MNTEPVLSGGVPNCSVQIDSSSEATALLQARIDKFSAADALRNREKSDLLAGMAATLGIVLGELIAQNVSFGTELYKGFRTEDEKEVVVKCYLGGLAQGSSEMIQRCTTYFETEKRTLHQAIESNARLYPGEQFFPPLLAALDQPEVKLLVLGFLPYKEGREVFKSCINGGKPFGEAALLNFLTTGLKALHCLQDTGNLHRDLHPRNLIIKDDGSLFLLDLNTAKPIGQTNITSLEPENFYPLDAYGVHPSKTVDQFALGVIAACLYSGKDQYTVFGDKGVSIDALQLPEYLKPFFEKLCAPQLQDRFQTANDALLFLKSCAAKAGEANKQDASIVTPKVPLASNLMPEVHLENETQVSSERHQPALREKQSMRDKIKDWWKIKSLKKLVRIGSFDDGMKAFNLINELSTREAVKFLNRLASVYSHGRYYAENRCEIAAACGQVKDPRVVPILIRLAKDNDCRVRGSAATACGELKYPETNQILESLAKDNHPLVRIAVAECCGKISDTETIQILERLVADHDWDVRRSVAKACAQIEYSVAIRTLRLLKDDPDFSVRKAVAACCVKIGGPLALKILKEQQNDDSYECRIAAFGATLHFNTGDALEMIKREVKMEGRNSHQLKSMIQICGEIRNPESLEILRYLSDDGPNGIGIQLARVCGKIDTPESFEIVRKYIDSIIVSQYRDSERDLMSIAEECGKIRTLTSIKILEVLLEKSSQKLHTSIARACKELKMPEALPILESIILRAGATDAGSYMNILGWFPPSNPAVIATIEKLLTRRSDLNSLGTSLLRHRAAFMSSPAELEILKRLLKDDDSSNREEIALSLSKSSSADTLKILETLAIDPERRVRAAAKDSLIKRGYDINSLPFSANLAGETGSIVDGVCQ